MSINLTTPGVYIEEVSTIASSIVRESATMPIFIGHTAVHHNGKTNNMGSHGHTAAYTVGSLAEYVELFGTNRSKAFDIEVIDTYDPQKVRLTRNVVIKPGIYLMHYAMQHYFANGGGPCKVISVADMLVAPTASEFNDALIDMETLHGCQLLVIPEMTVGASTYRETVDFALAHCKKVGNRFLLIDAPYTGVPSADAASLRSNTGTENLSHGAAYYPFLQTNIKHDFDENVVLVKHTILGATVVSEFDGKSVAVVKSKDLSLYNEIVNHIAALPPVVLPPSAAVAGQIVRNDREKGLWKAPANISLNAVISPMKQVTQVEQDQFNVDAETGKSINVIRNFHGRGTMIWGARTLAGNDNEWRYISVRRLFTTAENAIRQGSEWAVFEPNDANTWLRLKTMIEVYLQGLWRDGALAGAKPKDAFFVKVGLGITMTPQDILNGILRIEVGIAAQRPAEFIILKVSQMMQQS